MVLLIAVGVLQLLCGGVDVPLFSITGGGSVSLPASLLLPALACAGVGLSLAGERPACERTSVRPLPRIDILLVGGYCLVFLALGLLQRACGSDLAVESTRNALGFVGMTCLTIRFLGRALGTVLPPMYVMLAVALGDGRHPRPWTWFLVQHLGPEDLAAALCLLIGGVWCWSSTDRYTLHVPGLSRTT